MGKFSSHKMPIWFSIFFGPPATQIVVLSALVICLFYFNKGFIWRQHTSEVYKPLLYSNTCGKGDEWAPFYSRQTGGEQRPDAPRILLWNLPFGIYVVNLSKDVKVMTMSCPEKCWLSYDRSTIKASDAVVFHGSDLRQEDMPQWRASGQKWVYWNIEPPPRIQPLAHMNGVFNWTMTYLSESDFYQPYGRATQHKMKQHLDFEKLKRTWQNKSTLAVWAVSHCSVDSRREEYVRELRKFANVHVYGKCGTKKCPKENSSACYEMFSKKYFFHLSFENSICREYVTEKLFNVLIYDIIPVVLGGANYTAVAPPGSFINALSFRSPQKLAQYLKHVANDFNIYAKYMLWKTTHSVVKNTFVKGPFCDICKRLHGSAFGNTTVVSDVEQRWNTTAHCRSWNSKS